jgi:ketosteroid isomerase-like protein
MRPTTARQKIHGVIRPSLSRRKTVSTATPDRAAANLATVQEIYAAFGRRDVPAILDVIAEDCHWEAWAGNSAQQAGVPDMQPRSGPSGVGEFFAAVAELEIHEFKVLDYMTGRDQIAAEVVIEASTPAGGRFRDEEVHLWTLGAGGKVVRLRHYVDTAKHIAAAAGKDTTSRG